MKLKEIPLYPTKFFLDLWVSDDHELLSKRFSERYGAASDYYYEELSPNGVCTIESGKDTELKGETRIVMNIAEINHLVIVHEANHVLFHLSKQCGLEICWNSQEWTSYMLEYLFECCSEF